MKNKEYINQQVDDTLGVLNTIEKVDVPPFFRHKVLQKLKAEREVKQSVFNWFTPQLQYATLCVVLLLNFGTIFYAFNTSQKTGTTSSGIELFAQEYSLQSESNSILN
ncbi:MAG: hypothetical protein ACI9SI_000753 [Polaribacter sp.]|jgi:hypothetical protein